MACRSAPGGMDGSSTTINTVRLGSATYVRPVMPRPRLAAASAVAPGPWLTRRTQSTGRTRPAIVTVTSSGISSVGHFAHLVDDAQIDAEGGGRARGGCRANRGRSRDCGVRAPRHGASPATHVTISTHKTERQPTDITSSGSADAAGYHTRCRSDVGSAKGRGLRKVRVANAGAPGPAADGAGPGGSERGATSPCSWQVSRTTTGRVRRGRCSSAGRSFRRRAGQRVSS